MTVRIRRAYDEPLPEDGYRVLVDRIWPRGRRRETLQLGEWARALAPSDALRKWFGHDPGRWDEFQAQYRHELGRPDQARLLDQLAERARTGTVTLVYSARDETHNQARVIADEIGRRFVRP